MIIFTVIFFSTPLLSLEYDCKLKIHVKNNSVTDPNVIDGIPYDEWLDLKNYNVLFLDQGNQLSMIILEEEFIENDPPLPEELHACLTVAGGHIDDAVREIPKINEALTLVGLAGTVSSVAAIEIGLEKYDRERIHHFRLSKDAVEDVFRTLATENRQERTSNPGLDEDRTDVIVAGTAILVKVMRQLEFTECLVSESDILDGILHSMLFESEN